MSEAIPRRLGARRRDESEAPRARLRVPCTVDGGRRAHRAPADELNNRDGGKAIGKQDWLAPAGGDCDCKRPLY